MYPHRIQPKEEVKLHASESQAESGAALMDERRVGFHQGDGLRGAALGDGLPQPIDSRAGRRSLGGRMVRCPRREPKEGTLRIETNAGVR